jgi:hypothetical protein
VAGEVVTGDRDLAGCAIERIELAGACDPNEHVRRAHRQRRVRVLGRVGRVPAQRPDTRVLDNRDQVFPDQIVVVDRLIGAAVGDDDQDRASVP